MMHDRGDSRVQAWAFWVQFTVDTLHPRRSDWRREPATHNASIRAYETQKLTWRKARPDASLLAKGGVDCLCHDPSDWLIQAYWLPALSLSKHLCSIVIFLSAIFQAHVRLDLRSVFHVDLRRAAKPILTPSRGHQNTPSDLLFFESRSGYEARLVTVYVEAIVRSITIFLFVQRVETAKISFSEEVHDLGASP